VVRCCCCAEFLTGEGEVLDPEEGENPFVYDPGVLTRFLCGVPLRNESVSLLSESSEENEVASHVVNTLQADLRGVEMVRASLVGWSMAQADGMTRYQNSKPLY
jgi:hypothetical protein